jgi:hypothetical protein
MRDKIMELFNDTCGELWGVIEQKAHLYGWSRFGPHSDQFNYWMCFSDIHRKTLRLEMLTEQALRNSSTNINAREKLIDDYRDIANYAIMAIIILEEQNDRTNSTEG